MLGVEPVFGGVGVFFIGMKMKKIMDIRFSD
jgi:hypothetical protein